MKPLDPRGFIFYAIMRDVWYDPALSSMPLLSELRKRDIRCKIGLKLIKRWPERKITYDPKGADNDKDNLHGYGAIKGFPDSSVRVVRKISDAVPNQQVRQGKNQKLIEIKCCIKVPVQKIM